MKILRYVLPVVLALSGALFAAENATSPPSDYDRAVKAYVDAAGDQLSAIRSQVTAMAGVPPVEQSKKRLAKPQASLDECDKLLADLKKAGPQDFDRVKAKFEQTRGIMLKELDAAGKN